MSPTSPLASLRGAAKPRLELIPPYSYTLGPEACELARRAKLVPDPWQADSIDLLMAVREDGKWACFEFAEWVPRQNGKGAILEIRALAGFLLLGEQLIMWSAHEYKTAIRAFRRMKVLLKRLGKQVGNNENLLEVDGIRIKVLNTNGEEGFERLDTNAELKFIARSKSSGRGFTGDLNVIDEAFAYSRDQQDALMPTVRAVKDPQFVYTSTPPLNGDSAEVMYALRARAEAGGDDSLGYRDWGCAGDLDHLKDVDLDDPDLWSASNPALGIRISGEQFPRERRGMGDAGFARELLGIWPRVAQGNIVIDPKVWARLADEESRRTGGLAVAVDISPLRDNAAIGVYGTREDGRGHVQLVDYRPGTDWIIGRLTELKAALDPIAISMGRSTYASLQTELTRSGMTKPDDPDAPERGDLAVTSATEMAAATGQWLDATRQETYRYVPARYLDVAVAGAKTKAMGDALCWVRNDPDVDVTPLVAVTLARWAYETRSAALEGADYDVLQSIY